RGGLPGFPDAGDHREIEGISVESGRDPRARPAGPRRDRPRDLAPGGGAFAALPGPVLHLLPALPGVARPAPIQPGRRVASGAGRTAARLPLASLLAPRGGPRRRIRIRSADRSVVDVVLGTPVGGRLPPSFPPRRRSTARPALPQPRGPRERSPAALLDGRRARRGGLVPRPFRGGPRGPGAAVSAAPGRGDSAPRARAVFHPRG